MQLPTVSVIIPTYNRRESLRRALDTVLVQEGLDWTFRAEVLVVDDGSTDGTPDVVRAYDKVQYLRHDVNRGPSAARNTGVAAATGEYVAFLDDDDLWLPHKLRTQLRRLVDDPSVGLVYSQVLVQTGRGDFVWPHWTPEGSVLPALTCLPGQYGARLGTSRSAGRA